MLTVDAELPAAVLLDDADTLDDLVRKAGGEWISFEREWIDGVGGSIDRIAPRVGVNAARPVAANENNGRLQTVRGVSVWSCTPRINCGLVLSERVRADCLSIVAVVPGLTGQGGTIATLTGQDSARSYYLTEDAGRILFGERRNDTQPELACNSPEGAAVILLELTANGARLAVDRGDPAHALPNTPMDADDFEVLIAARRQQEGLLSTLGDLSLADLLVFPNQRIFDARHAALRAAVQDYKQGIFSDVVR